jgi:hypothetical protein
LVACELFQRNTTSIATRLPRAPSPPVQIFRALGWDMVNAGFAEQYKEVIHEDKVRVGAATKAPDYSFRLGRERKFFVEAKKPAVSIEYEIEPAYQLRRYAWSAKLPLSILTDFEEFSVYDCRSKPAPADKASTGRILLVNYKDYPARWDEIAGVFGKAAVWQGALDKYAEAKAGKRGTAEVDDEFLKEIETWRELLARNIALRNPALSQRELNFAVQRTIDRIIFLRICGRVIWNLRAVAGAAQRRAHLRAAARAFSLRRPALQLRAVPLRGGERPGRAARHADPRTDD